MATTAAPADITPVTLHITQERKLELKISDSTTLFYSMATFNTQESFAASTDTDAALDAEILSTARRPYRGISIKKESFASISIVKRESRSTLSDTKLKNSSADADVPFTCNFLINSVSETRNEKHQTVTTFGKDYVYFFGEQPRQMTFNVTLLNTENFRWEEEWWYNYEESFRGTRLAGRSEEIRLRLDESIIYGFLITCSTNKDSNNPHVVTLSFTVHVTDVVSTRSTLIGSSDVKANRSNGSAYGFVDLNIHDGGALNAISIGADSKAVRMYNLSQYLNSQSGWVARLRNGLDSFSSGLANIAQDAVDFLYGRNIVLPADVAYGEFVSGNPQFAEGTEAYEVMTKSLEDTSAKVYGKGLFNSTQYSNTTGVTATNAELTTYTDNYDEYPLKSAISKYSIAIDEEKAPKSLTELTADVVSKEFNIPKEDLLAGDNLILDPQRNTFLDGVRSFLSGASFGVFQTTTAYSDSVTRSKAAELGQTLTFPNESANLAAINGYEESENRGI